MPKTLTIDHVTRIEGHAKIDITLGENGRVESTQFHVTQFRGFERMTVGRPYFEMPAITARICGICPVSHLLASVKACDEIMAVRIPETASLLRELLHCAQFVQSHALSFFHLSAPDLLLGFDSDIAKRNVVGLAEKFPEAAHDGIALRKFGQHSIQLLAGERIHPSWTVPGGVNKALSQEARDYMLAELPIAMSIVRRTLKMFKAMLDSFQPEIESFGNMSSMHAGLTDDEGNLKIYDGMMRFRDSEGSEVALVRKPAEYSKFIGEATLPESYLKAPYFKPIGFPEGIYRVGPLGRLNACERCGTPLADEELTEYRQRLGRIVKSSFYYHYARLIEALYGVERMKELLEEPEIMNSHVRANASVNAMSGVGIVEAPRGTLIHHYKVNESGAITWANLIVATGHNNLAMNRSIKQVAERFIDGDRLTEGMLNRVSAVVRAYDPCLSCSTHASGAPYLHLRLLRENGDVADEMTS